MVVEAVYLAVTSAVSDLLADALAGVNAHNNMDEIIYYMGGTTYLPDLDDCICLSGGFKEEIEAYFFVGRL